MVHKLCVFLVLDESIWPKSGGAQNPLSRHYKPAPKIISRHWWSNCLIRNTNARYRWSPTTSDKTKPPHYYYLISVSRLNPLHDDSWVQWTLPSLSSPSSVPMRGFSKILFGAEQINDLSCVHNWETWEHWEWSPLTPLHTLSSVSSSPRVPDFLLHSPASTGVHKVEELWTSVVIHLSRPVNLVTQTKRGWSHFYMNPARKRRERACRYSAPSTTAQWISWVVTMV